MEKKTIYYTDPLTDDFAVNRTTHYEINDDFKYIHKNLIYRFFSFILYQIIAKLVLYIPVKIKYRIKVYNKKAVKKLKNTGFVVYMNHTQNIIDALLNQGYVFKRKGYLLASNSVYSIKGIKTIVNMLGCLPIPNNMVQSKKLFDAISYYLNKKAGIVILPEAHIWPYYNDIREFSDAGFIFPAVLNKPILVTTVVYRPNKNPNKPPHISIYVSEPIYPRSDLSAKENQKYLRDEAYKFMKETVKNNHSYEYVHYEQKNSKNENQPV